LANFTGNDTGFDVTFHFLAQVHLQYHHKTPRNKLKQFFQLVDEIYLTKMTLFMYVCLHFNISITAKVYEHSQLTSLQQACSFS